MTTSYTHVLSRAKRQARVTALLARLTAQVRQLSSSDADAAAAGVIVRRYCRAIGAPPASAAAVDFLLSVEVAEITLEDLDEMLFEGDFALGFAAAHEAIGRAGRGK